MGVIPDSSGSSGWQLPAVFQDRHFFAGGLQFYLKNKQ